jgi:hypothetical protein
MTIGAYIIVLATANVTAAKNEDLFLTTYGIKDEHFTDIHRVVALFKRQIYKRGVYARTY